ncbi:Spo0E like sporulation regulatory protein [Melghirimyces profundicolus]|uniref:Spo0E like sporulation regulatory protein n=1 Tax=Melghirimyces profundicolus TaxID=1242148 RepID=A0A2T6BST5_9BACL|nr:aspartyl-phosphate phosphatase Spo0E family protein [Melghirimyces profundicolus]PTX59133.1 Spo0E like sporulation regulatory protein [Melghirimyces profundicolus]
MGRCKLEEEMERLRTAMQHQAERLGMNHPTVVQISQQLDELHNQWNRWHYPSSDADHRAAYIIRRYTSKIREVAVDRA